MIWRRLGEVETLTPKLTTAAGGALFRGDKR